MRNNEEQAVEGIKKDSCFSRECVESLFTS